MLLLLSQNYKQINEYKNTKGRKLEDKNQKISQISCWLNIINFLSFISNHNAIVKFYVILLNSESTL